MRIGMITGEYPPMEGGIGAYTRILSQTLAGMRHDVFVLTQQQGSTPYPGITLNNSIKRWGVGSWLTVRKWVKENQLDVVNIQFQTAAFNMSPFIHFLPDRITNVPVVTTFHDLRFPYLFPKAGPLRDWIVMHLVEASDGVIVTNHEDHQKVNHLPHTTLIPIGSNIIPLADQTPDTTIWRKKAGASDDDFLIVHFGFINFSKGVYTLVEAARMLRDIGKNIRIVMVGGKIGSSDPTNVQYLAGTEEHIKANGLWDYTYWTDFVSDEEVAGFMRAADAVVLPFRDGASYRRGSLMAAIQLGCPIITTEPPVPIAAFKEGENMLLVKPDVPELLAKAIHKLMDDQSLCEKLRQGARDLQETFSWEHIALDYLAFYRHELGVHD